MHKHDLFEEALTRSVIGAFYDVYNTLGFGFLEHLYLTALERELVWRGHQVGREVNVPVWYKGQELGAQRLDMLVDGKLVLEAKSSHDLPPIASRQLYNYLRGSNLQLGLLLHFGPRPRFYRVFRQLSSAQMPAPHPEVLTHASDEPNTSD